MTEDRTSHAEKPAGGNDARDIPPDDGKRPSFAEAADPNNVGEAGSGPGYSGQEYDNAGQRAWRARQKDEAAPDGEVRGSGIGAGGGSSGEDFDSDRASGDGDDRG